ncbi:unnamed protein product, partial [Ilex paraguariensis]
FASRLLAWILSRIMGASVTFRVGGWKCLRDVVVKFNKGAVESVSVGEIRLSLRQSLVKLGVGFISRDPKLQVLICDLEVVMRSSNRRFEKTRSRRSRSSGRGKWMVVANIARFLSVSVTELVVKMPKATIEVKELRMDISKDGGSRPALFVKLHLLPITVHLGEPQVSCDHSSNFNNGGCVPASQTSFAMMERASAPFSCEEFSISCEFGHDRKAGVVVKNVDIKSGEVTLSLNEEMFLKKKSSSDAFSHIDEVLGSTVESDDAKKPHKKQISISAITKYTSMFPEKVSFILPKLDVKFVHRVHDLAVENNIMGVQLKSVKSQTIEDVGESTRLDIQLDFSEIHLCREAGASIVEILKLDVVSSVYIPLQPTSPIRSEIDVKLGGTQCNLIMSRLKPWMRLRSTNNRKMVLREDRSSLERPQSADIKAIMWTCTLSAPEMTIVIYNLSDSPLYHPTSPIRSEIDVKLGGTQCNLIMSRLKPWMRLRSTNNRKMVLREDRSSLERPQSADIKAIMWTCTLSAPEMTIVIYNLSDSPLYHGCSQSSHFFANNISSSGTAVHVELGEVNLHMADEYHECLKESLFGVESNTGSLMHIAKISLDGGKKDMDSLEEDVAKYKSVLCVDVTGMGVYLNLKRVESLISTALSFMGLLKHLSASGRKPAHSRGERPTRPSGKGTQLIKFNLERCFLNFCGEVGLENSVVADPKRVNYGSHGGRVLISTSTDGSLRTANIMSTMSDECQKLKYSISLDIFHFSLSMNKEKQSTQMELERAKSIYLEYLKDTSPGTKVVLLDMQNAKFVRRAGGLKEISVCSLFSATDITVRWEPDVHIALFELMLHLKVIIHNQKLQERDSILMEDISSMRDTEQKKETPMESVQLEKQCKKRESVFAIDVEVLNIFAEVGDGVDAMMQVQSIFSENARIGVLLEGLMLRFNGARVFKSSRMQISRIPSASSSFSSDAKLAAATTWDWVIQAIDVHICMPYRLQLRAIDDSIEEMLRALKLITASKTKLIFPMKGESTKPKKPSSTKFGCVKFCIRKLTADIEEEPIQGWFDEHYQLLKNEASELAVRLNFLDEIISKGSQGSRTAETNDSTHEDKIHFNEDEIDVHDASAIQKLQEEIYKQSFRSYYQACQNLVPSEGSGSCSEEFQAGFNPSTARTSLFSISATEFDLSLTRIEGGDDGMIKVLQQLDPVCLEYNIPFSRLYGCNILLHTGSLAVHVRNYTYPLFSATSGRCEGRVVLAQQLTADIEEEPIQGWFDEHYQLLKNEASELAVRLNFLDEIISKGSQGSRTAETNDSTHEDKIHFNEDEIDVHDASAIQKLQEEIYKQSFRSYYQACQNLVPSEGSGSCSEEFQAGFNPSTARTSLFSISATEFDLSLTRIEGGDDGMIKVLQQLDPVCLEYNIPFSRLYGCNILLHTGSLAVHVRNYTYPLFSATSGRCEGRVVLAQQKSRETSPSDQSPTKSDKELTISEDLSATCFQPQIHQNVFIGRWRKVCLLRSASGTTPPMKTYSDLPIHFQKAEVSYGVGFEPAFADVSYAFTVALRRANLSTRNPNASDIQPPKKERSLPWWDEMRNYIHGNINLFFSETRWNVLATTDPYEKCDKLQMVSGLMEIQQSDGRVYVSAKDFKILLSSLESLLNNCGLKCPTGTSGAFLEAPAFTVEVTMDWECDSGNPLNHYLYALPNEGVPREKVFDPFRSTSLSLRWNLSLRPSLASLENQSQSSTMGDNSLLDGAIYGPFKSENLTIDSPSANVGPHDLAWLIKFWNMNYLPPHKLRTFSRWPRFGIPRIARSGNLSLDKVMTEFMFRIDSTPACVRHMALEDDDPAKGLAFKMTKLKHEMCYSRGKQKYTFECKRDPLDLVYQGLDLHMPKAYVNKDCMSVAKVVQSTRKSSQSTSTDRVMSEKCGCMSSITERHRDDGFLLSSDYFTIRRQAPKADPSRLLAWQEAGRRNLEMTYVRSEFENGSESDEHTRSDHSGDEGYNVVIADNCQRIFVYGLKLLWTLENRDAVWSWVGGISKAFEPPKPSPSRQYAQRKLVEENQILDKPETLQDDVSKPHFVSHDANFPSPQPVEASGSIPSPVQSNIVENPSLGEGAKNGNNDDSKEGTGHFMVNVIEPQFNLHSEEANGRFLLAAVSGRVLARSFHSVLHVGYEMIEQALGPGNLHVPECQPEMTWNRMEVSVMLEHVQAHVAPTDVDPGAGLQWLPRIRRSSPKVKRTGALLERVFMPCDMYFRYTRHKGGTADLKVKPLKELTFNSDNITATMTSRQFQVMLDVLTNLLFARLPKPRKSSLSYPAEDDEDVEEEADEVVPDGVEEVELARVNVEQKERMKKLIIVDIRKLSLRSDISGDLYPEKEGDLWMVTGGRSTLIFTMASNEEAAVQEYFSRGGGSIVALKGGVPESNMMRWPVEKSSNFMVRSYYKTYLLEKGLNSKALPESSPRGPFIPVSSSPHPLLLGQMMLADVHLPATVDVYAVHRLKKELRNAQKSRKAASASLRIALQKAAQLRLMEKEKNKSPSYAMRISLQIHKVVWGMLVDGRSFAEAEINDLIYDFDRDYKDVGVARFTTKYFVVRNCLPNAKSDMLLSAWNPPPEWGKKVMLRVDAKQGAPKDRNSPLELFQPIWSIPRTMRAIFGSGRPVAS